MEGRIWIQLWNSLLLGMKPDLSPRPCPDQDQINRLDQQTGTSKASLGVSGFPLLSRPLPLSRLGTSLDVSFNLLVTGHAQIGPHYSGGGVLTATAWQSLWERGWKFYIFLSLLHPLLCFDMAPFPGYYSA